MRKYILATHGQMAYGMNTTLNMLIGEQENLTIINAYTEECKDPVPEFEKIIEENPDDDIIIMTDLFGGSVNNNAMLMTKHQRVHVVTGINCHVGQQYTYCGNDKRGGFWCKRHDYLL